MSKTINKTLASGNNDYFDLFDYIDECKHAMVAANMASSTAWRMDTMIVSGARQLLKSIKTELFNHGGVESMNEAIACLEDQDFAEESFNEIGTSPEASGIIETLRMLNAQRTRWHDLAERLTSMTSDYRGQPSVYVIPDIDAAFSKDPALRVNELTQRRLKIRSERMASALEAPELAAQHYERSLQRKRDDNVRIASVLKDQAHIAQFMFTLALRNDPIGANKRSMEFYDLPLAAQRMLLDNAGNAAMRADERAADDRNMTETEYDMVSLLAIKAMTDMKKVMTAPRFRVQFEESTR